MLWGGGWLVTMLVPGVWEHYVGAVGGVGVWLQCWCQVTMLWVGSTMLVRWVGWVWSGGGWI